jgi:hypothetical protein
MTRQEVEQTLGPSPFQGRDRQGNVVLQYRYPSQQHAPLKDFLDVTIDPASGKVVRVDTRPPH